MKNDIMSFGFRFQGRRTAIPETGTPVRSRRTGVPGIAKGPEAP